MEYFYCTDNIIGLRGRCYVVHLPERENESKEDKE